jgi:DNA-binding transcriptional MerR regulator
MTTAHAAATTRAPWAHWARRPALLALSLLLWAPLGPALAQYAPAPPKTPIPLAEQGVGKGPALRIEGDYDIQELRRLIDVARESGFTEAQIREIVIEDENGNVVNAWEFLQAYERRRREREALLAAQRARVYLAPQDILKELDETKHQDLDALRERMLFVE